MYTFRQDLQNNLSSMSFEPKEDHIFGYRLFSHFPKKKKFKKNQNKLVQMLIPYLKSLLGLIKQHEIDHQPTRRDEKE
jgi:hypothetical protein